MEVFAELTTTIIFAFGFAALMMKLKQPLLIGYIIAGIVIGPYGLNIITSTQTIELFATLGITALLFIVGLNLSPNVIKEVGKVALVTGTGQVLFTSLIGYLITRALGFGAIESLYIAMALTFSSTIIILKLLSDKGDTQKLYGRIAIGFLLVQDLIATISLVTISSIASSSNSDNLFLQVGFLLIKGFFLLFGILFLAKKILPNIIKYFAKSSELLFIFSLAWGIGIGLIYSKVGLTVEIGALVAGIALSLTQYNLEISSRLKPIRDFFIVLFFINLGYHFEFSEINNLIVPTIVLSIFILIGNPLIVYVLMNLLGYTKKTSFLGGLTVAQISEFSLILIALGVSVGQVSKSGSSVVTMVGIITIALSTYLIIYSESIYQKSKKLLALLEIRKNNKDHLPELKLTDAILFGCHRVGLDFIKAFEDKNMSYIIVDHNPQIVSELRNKSISVVYGDAEDVEFLDEIQIHNIKLVISTIPDQDTNLFLVNHIRKNNKDTVIIVIAENVIESQNLYTAGADYVVMPHYIGANIAAEMITEFGFCKENYKKVGEKHQKYLSRRKEIIS